MATMNFSLPDPMKDWVEAQVKTGRYSNASDYVRDLIRKEKARTDKIAEMQRFVDDGITSGVGSRSSDELLLKPARERRPAASVLDASQAFGSVGGGYCYHCGRQ